MIVARATAQASALYYFYTTSAFLRFSALFIKGFIGCPACSEGRGRTFESSRACQQFKQVGTFWCPFWRLRLVARSFASARGLWLFGARHALCQDRSRFVLFEKPSFRRRPESRSLKTIIFPTLRGLGFREETRG